MPLLLKKYFYSSSSLSRRKIASLQHFSQKIVDKHIWQWMWTVVIFQVTMKLRTTQKQIMLRVLFRIYACINIRKTCRITLIHTYISPRAHIHTCHKHVCSYVASLIHITPTHNKNSIYIRKCKIANVSKHERWQINRIHIVKSANKLCNYILSNNYICNWLKIMVESIKDFRLGRK